uniref:Large ribosomal subunit protein uL4m n=1 Tax=Aceria tosichella TaxID=561515 RepID=A0A6G1SNE4_9ACAR
MALTNKITNKLLKDLVGSQLKYTHLFNPKISPPRQAWVENFIGGPRELLGIVELHPKVFGVFPRMDYVSSAIIWQKSYRNINYICMPTRNELPGGTKKPWPQKGTGRARHGSTNSPIFLKGGWVRGPRGPTTQFRLEPHFNLVNALTSMLTIKLAQDDIKIVDSIEAAISEDPEELEKSFEDRGWGPSVLIVDKRNTFPENITRASSSLGHVNLMSLVGLNTLSLCKHETLVITLEALREIEDKLLHQLVRTDLSETRVRYREDE